MEIPTSLIIAVNTIIDLNIGINDEVVIEIYAKNNKKQTESVIAWIAYHSDSHELEIGWDWLIDNNRINRLSGFAGNEILMYDQAPDGNLFEILNIKSLDIGYSLEFLLDYYHFFNPEIPIDEICTDIHFNTAMNEEEVVDIGQTEYTFTIFPDGTDSGKEQLERCIAFLNQKRELESKHE